MDTNQSAGSTSYCPQGTAFVSKPIKRLKHIWKEYTQKKKQSEVKYQFKFSRRKKYLRKTLDSWLSSTGFSDKDVEKYIQQEVVKEQSEFPLHTQLKQSAIILRIDSHPNAAELRKFVQELCMSVGDKFVDQEVQRWDKLLPHIDKNTTGNNLIEENVSSQMVALLQKLRCQQIHQLNEQTEYLKDS
eukprot:TRINITY_DN63792_c1_g1_i5.p2 TRINITY_DN63792_c1_g1~~TRINITY_DN63792_c1_g1_i5.p2  ORF type:complete len:196 (-),score=13.79 TRINITY_DN63792_c1_g1_i5:417-977(-)